MNANEAKQTTMADDINEKALYLLQIQHLEEQLESSQLVREEMEKKNQHLASKYSAMETEQKNMIKPLECNLAVKEEAKFEVLDQMDQQKEAAKQDEKNLIVQHSELMQKLQKQLDEVTSQRRMLEAEFDEQEEQVEVDIRSVEKQLSQKIKHQTIFEPKLTESDKVVVMLKRKVNERVRANLSDVEKQDSVHHQRSLEYLDLLLSENTLLQEQHDLLRRKQLNALKLITTLKKKIILTNAEILTNQTTVMRLTRSCIQLQSTLERQSIIHKKQRQDLQDTMETLSQDLDSVCADYGKITARLKQLEADDEITTHKPTVKAWRNISTMVRVLFESLDHSGPDPNHSEPDPKHLDLSEPDPKHVDHSGPDPNHSEPDPKHLDHSEPDPNHSEPDPKHLDHSEPDPNHSEPDPKHLDHSEPDTKHLDYSEPDPNHSEPDPQHLDHSEPDPNHSEPDPKHLDHSEPDPNHSEPDSNHFDDSEMMN